MYWFAIINTIVCLSASSVFVKFIQHPVNLTEKRKTYLNNHINTFYTEAQRPGSITQFMKIFITI